METRFTIIDDGRKTDVAAFIEGERVRLPPAAVTAALGWELEPQGLCKEAVCLPVQGDADALNEDGIDLEHLAQLLSRPLALDVAERTACLGVSAGDRSAQLASLQAPDFTLPDLAGRMHSLSDYRGNKVLLIAYASW